jgi:hypothetical protein
MIDKKKHIAMKCEFISEGMTWPIDIFFEVPLGTPAQAKITMKDLTSWLLVAGFRPAKHTFPDSAGQPGGQLNGQPMHQHSAIVGSGAPAAPMCPIHRAEMKISKVQKKPGEVAYYCTRQDPQGYCKQRGTVAEGGKLSLWEVSS